MPDAFVYYFLIREPLDRQARQLEAPGNARGDQEQG